MSQPNTEQVETPDERPLFKDALQLVAQQIPARVMAWLWTVHVMHGDDNCPAHRQGEQCCIDLLLESSPAITGTPQSGVIADIIRAGYDLVIESDGDDRDGPINVYLSYQGQGVTDDLKLAGMPATIEQTLAKARDYAAAFPNGVIE